MAEEEVDTTAPEEKDGKIKVGFNRNELGRTGLKHYSGLLYEEFLPQLQGQKANKIYREMQDNSPVIGAVMYAVESTLRSVDWSVEPATDDSADIEAAEFLESAMHDMSHTWEDFISEILTMLTYGWSYFEVVYKKREGRTTETGRRRAVGSRYNDNKIGWRKFAPRGQDTLYRWEIDQNGGIRGMWQYPWPTGAGLIYDADERSSNTIYLPMERSLLFRTTSRRNNPEGRSMLRTAYRPWYFSKRVEEVEAIGLERDLAGMPFAGVPLELLEESPSPEAAATLQYVKDVVTKTKRDEQEGIVWPLAYDEDGNKLYEFDLISTGGRRTFDTGAIIQRYMQQMAMTVLADFILLGHEAVGSFALSSDKTELFAVALGSMLDAIEDTINRHAAPRLLALNGFPVDEKQPMLRHGDIEKPDLQELIQYVSSLAAAGAPLFPDLVLENRLRELADLPLVTEEEREEMEQAKMEEAQAMMGGMETGMGAAPGQGMEQPSPFGQQGKAGRPQTNFGNPQSKNEASTTGGGSGRPAGQSTNKPQSTEPKRAQGSAISKALEEVLAQVGQVD